MKRIVGIMLVGALAVAGCGGSGEQKVEIGAPARSVATTTTIVQDTVVCIQSAASPCPPASTATFPEAVVDRSQLRAAQSDLRNALTTQKVYYTDTQEYTADIEELKAIEPSLDWGGKLKVVVGSSDEIQGWNSVLCMSTTAASGETLAIGDYAPGATYFDTAPCPDEITVEALRKMGDSW